MTKKNNMFAQAEERRRTELKKTEDAVREEREVRIGTTIMLTARNKTALKQYAAATGSTVSNLINAWIIEKCEGYPK